MIITKAMEFTKRAKTAPYELAIKCIAEAATPKSMKEALVSDGIDIDSFFKNLGVNFAENLSFEDLKENGLRLQKEFSENGFIRDIETGNVLPLQETLDLLRTYGTIISACEKSYDLCISEALNPDKIQLQKLEETLKKETAEMEEKLGTKSVEEVRKRVEHLNTLRQEIKDLKDKTTKDAEEKVKKVLDILYELLRIFQVANMSTMILSGNFTPALAATPFTKAYFCHPVVIAAIVVDIIWIIGPKNIPLLSEIWDLLESLIAKLTVTAGGIVGFTIDTIKDGLNAVMGKKKIYGESQVTMSADEINKRIDKANSIPQPIKDVIEKNGDIANFAKEVFKSVVVDLKKDAIETDRIKREEEEENSRIKIDIADKILASVTNEDPTFAAGILGKLGSDEVAGLAPTEDGGDSTGGTPTTTNDPTKNPPSGNTNDDGDSDHAEEDLIQDDNADDEAKAMAEVNKYKESFIYQRRQELFAMANTDRFNKKAEVSYIDVIQDAAIQLVIKHLEN